MDMRIHFIDTEMKEITVELFLSNSIFKIK